MSEKACQEHIYQVEKTQFIVTPVYQSNRGEPMSMILLKLMKAEINRKKLAS